MAKKITVNKAIAALRLHRGNLTQAALSCGTSRWAFYKFLDQHPEIQTLREEISEELLDVAEDKIVAAIVAGDLKTIRWYMDRQGKDRGYTTRTETTGKDGEPLNPMTVRREIVDPVEEADA